MSTYGEALATTSARLRESGVATAALDARLLLAGATGLDMAQLISRSRDPIPALALSAFHDHIQKRLLGEPVARILGEAEFWSLKFALNAATLVPRPETETVLKEVRRRKKQDLTICDLGTGAGIIAIALLRELTDATCVATDISNEALSMARFNAERHGVGARLELMNVSFNEGPAGTFDVVVSNPPYVRSDAIGGLQREVCDHDPRAALDGGPDGLDAYRSILSGAGALLSKDGVLALEVGYDQGDSVASLCRGEGFADIRKIRDLAGLPRVVIAGVTTLGDNPAGAKKALGKVG
jgi:release factor glutamine methyltransferase